MADLKDELAALRIERVPVMTHRRGWLAGLVALALCAAAGYGLWTYLTRERPAEVQVATASVRAAGTQAAVLNASGYVTARRRATVSSKITGKVMQVDVEEGRAVTEGQILARLDDAQARAALALAEAQLGTAERSAREDEVRLDNLKLTLERRQRLVKEGFAMQAEVDDAKSAVEALAARLEVERQQVVVARRQVELEQTNIDNAVIRAPFSGIAISKDAQPGEMVSPVSAGGGFTRTGICTIVDMRSLEIEVDVNESYINRVRPGQKVTALLDAYQDWAIPAHVITVVPTADRQKATVLVRIGFARASGSAASALDPRLLPDMGVKVTFLRDEAATAGAAPVAQPAVLVPKVSIVNVAGQDYVFVVSGERVVRTAVKVGGADGDRVEVVGGLGGGERVVVSPARELAHGAMVIVK